MSFSIFRCFYYCSFDQFVPYQRFNLKSIRLDYWALYFNRVLGFNNLGIEVTEQEYRQPFQYDCRNMSTKNLEKMQYVSMS